MGMLSTGAGAAEGLETLLARMRAEEVLGQHQQQLDQTRDYQGAMISHQNRQDDRLEANDVPIRELSRIKLDALKPIIAGMGGSSGAGTSGAGEIDHSVVPGGPDDTGMREVSGAMSPFGNDATGRTRMQIAGLNPNETYGAVRQPTVKGPEDLSAEETFYTGKAKAAGFPDYKAWGATDPHGLARARHEWEENSRIISPAQSSEPMMLVDDPDNPGNSIYMPRSGISGMRGPKPAAQKDRLAAYDASIALVNNIIKTGDEISWKGLGPVKGRVGRIGMEYFGKGDPREEQLRNQIDQLKAAASFQEGGKQFTGTEKALLDNFLAGVNQDPHAVRQRLDSFLQSAERSRSSLGAGGVEGQATQPGAKPKTAPGKYTIEEIKD